MKAWLKGGTIGLFVGIALVILVFLSEFIFICRFVIGRDVCGIFTYILAIPVIIISSIVGMIIGAVIGRKRSSKK